MQQLTQICQARENWADWKVPPDCSEVVFQWEAICTWFCIHSACERTTAETSQVTIPRNNSSLPLVPSSTLHADSNVFWRLTWLDCSMHNQRPVQ